MNGNPEVEAMSAPQIVLVDTLGNGNKGGISAADMSPAGREQFIQDVAAPEYHVNATQTWICVDGRADENLASIGENSADPQSAGGIAVTRAAGYYMRNRNATSPVGKKLTEKTDEAIAEGLGVTVHGGHDEVDCGAIKQLVSGQTLRDNAENRDEVAGRVWAALGVLDLQQHLSMEDIYELIAVGAENASNEALFDVTALEASKAAQAHGAQYRQLKGNHREYAVLLMTQEGKAFDKERFAANHTNEDGTTNDLFVVTLGEYKREAFKHGLAAGLSDRECALDVAAAGLWNTGVAKALTAEETGKGEALPLVVVQ